MAETRHRRNSGAAENPARRATPNSLPWIDTAGHDGGLLHRKNSYSATEQKSGAEPIQNSGILRRLPERGIGLNINTLRRKAKANTLEVEDILAAAKDRIPGLQAELQYLSTEYQWSDTPFPAKGGHVVPLAKWADIAGAYAEGGYRALAEMNALVENRYYIVSLLQELKSEEANSVLFDLFSKIMDNPDSNLELAYHLADALNLKFSFKHSALPSDSQAAHARSFLMKLYSMADTEPNRCRVVCALRGVGDRTTINFLATIDPFKDSYTGLEKSALQAIRKRLRAAASKTD